MEWVYFSLFLWIWVVHISIQSVIFSNASDEFVWSGSTISTIVMSSHSNQTMIRNNSRWRHKIGTLSALALCGPVIMTGGHRSPVDSFHKRPVMRTFDVSLILARTDCWKNNLVAGETPWRSCDITVTRGAIWLTVARGHCHSLPIYNAFLFGVTTAVLFPYHKRN